MPRTKGSKEDKKNLEPYILAIAAIYSNNKMIGLRICDINNKKQKPMDASLVSCVSQVTNNPDIIKNIRMTPVGLNLINGSLDRLTKINSTGKVLETITYNREVYRKTPLLIINQIENIGYTVIDYEGKIRKLPTDKLITEAKLMTLANGVIQYIPEENREIAIGLDEPYIVTHVAKSKIGGTNVSLNLAMSANKDTKAVAESTKANVSNEIEYQDAFRAVSREQKKVIQDYYMWYTVDMFKELTNNIRLEIQPSKALKLTQIHRDLDWEMGGIVDTGALGFGRCTLGHPLRYEYHAIGRIPNNSKDNTSNVVEEIIFGETCSGDFFNIPVEDMRKLIKVRKKMSEEIEAMTYIQANNLNSEMWKGNSLLLDVINKLGGEKCVKIFGEKLTKTLANFINVNMPFPESLVKQARKAAYRTEGTKVGTGGAFWKMVFPEYSNVIDYVYGGQATNNNILRTSYDYLEFMCYNKLDGSYAYDPIKKIGKGEGGFNSKTRTERTYLLSRIRQVIKCGEFSLNELEDLLKTLDIMLKITDNLKKYYTGYNNISEIGMNLLKASSRLRDHMYENCTDELKKTLAILDVTSSSLGVLRGGPYEFTNKLLNKVRFSNSRYYRNDTNIILVSPNNTHEVYKIYLEYGNTKELFNYLDKQSDLDRQARQREEQRIKEAEEQRRKIEQKEKISEIRDNIRDYLDRTANIRNKMSETEDRNYYIVLMSNVKNQEERRLSNIKLLIYQSRDKAKLMITDYSSIEDKDYDEQYVINNYSNPDIELMMEDTTKYGIVNFINKLKPYIENLIYSEHIVGIAKLEELKDRAEKIVYENNLIRYNKMDRLASLLKDSASDDYYEKISRDIISRGLKYERLTPKQKYIIDTTLNKLSNPATNTVSTSEKDLFTEEIAQELRKIIDRADKDGAFVAELKEIDSIGLDIIRTVLNKSKLSFKQKRHIDKIMDYCNKKD